MRLKEEDAALFYELFFPLLEYVNEKNNIIEGKLMNDGNVNPDQAAGIAKVLWDDTSIIDDYLNDHKELPQEHHDILESWKLARYDHYVIERHLKKGSIFISFKDGDVYLVQGIISSYEEIFWYQKPPIIVEGVIIPFKDVIITDGLFYYRPIRFGGGAKTTFKDTYMNAKHSGSIITSL